ncbi:hypothetical protein C8F04DRAFT_1360988 [Mycena alexandri]|uniref:Protein CPL1-like domain-containing protein n=1 Tax=Mycena alexandri TaxID=1745969 RepID=A0AAD6SQG1_9AGAR|nr:hypothetical protein C8F04DRAFT_1360988 [Mycena alexandri]
MHFTSALTIFTLATISCVLAHDITPRHIPRGSPTTTTSTPDVCGCISGTLKVNGHYVGVFGTEFCACLSVLSDVVTTTTSPIILLGLRQYGHDNVVSTLRDMIDSCEDKNKKTCTHPTHSVPNCSRKDLCGHTCQAPWKDCNGQCKMTCQTGTLSQYKRDDDYWGKRTQRSCRDGWTACGVPGGGPRDWECVDTHNDLESCGGCPTGVISSLTGDSVGKDCSTIAHVSDVSCVHGGCAVHKCLRGFRVSDSGDSCVKAESSFFRNTLQAAAAYGLEHLPFHK